MRSHGIPCATLPRKPRFVNGRTLVLCVEYALRGGFGLGLRLIDGGLLGGLCELMPAECRLLRVPSLCGLCGLCGLCRRRSLSRLLHRCGSLSCLVHHYLTHCRLLHLPNPLRLHHLHLLQLLLLTELLLLHIVLRLGFSLDLCGLLRLELLISLGLRLTCLLRGQCLQLRLLLGLSRRNRLQPSLLLCFFLGFSLRLGFGFCLGFRFCLGLRFSLGACGFCCGLLCRFSLGFRLCFDLIDE